MSDDLEKLEQLAFSGGLANATRAELERFAMALVHPHAYAKFGDRQFPKLCETVRLLLTVYISRESNAEATRISKIALIVSAFALIAGCVQAVAAVASWLSAPH